MPAFHFWFTGSALFTIGSFVLFAVIGFAGIASMTTAYRKIMYGGYAVAFVLFLLGWWQSAQQEQSSSRRDVDFSVVQAAINKIAGSADVSLNQSANEIAAAVIKKIEPLQKQVETLSRRPNDELYQDGLQLARVAGMNLDDAKTTVSFQVVTASHEIDFSREIELQGARLLCGAVPVGLVVASGANQSLTYRNVTCKVVGAR